MHCIVVSVFHSTQENRPKIFNQKRKQNGRIWEPNFNYTCKKDHQTIMNIYLEYTHLFLNHLSQMSNGNKMKL